MVILDLRLPGDQPWLTTSRLRALRPELPILICSMFPEAKMGVNAIAAGAGG